MFQFFTQVRTILSEMPLSRKLAVGALLFVTMALFGGIIFWSSVVEYRPLYTGLSQEDAAQVVSRLKELKVPYKLENGGSGVSVPLEKVYELRLSMASEGLPKGGGVGFEIFNKTEFGTTEFVQKLNFQRALQGELSRTIREIDEVQDARVLIVMPKDSVFVEETKPPSASVLLKLKRSLPPSRVNAVVHLVASSVEDLTPDRVTVVDTKGKILSSGSPEDPDKQLMNSQLSYKIAYEKSVTDRIQSMLERIVGQGKCIVRVTADMDFSKVDVSEELYDPDGQVVRSRQSGSEKSDRNNIDSRKISSVNPLPPDESGTRSETKERNDDTVNYEISRTTRRTTRPLGEVTRLSVAAVLDGTYTIVTAEDGARSRQYNPRTPEEMKLFSTIVRQAMGYSADREDQVSVESIPFTPDDGWQLEAAPLTGVDKLVEDYGKAGINLLVVLLIFLFVVRPLIKTLRDVSDKSEDPLLDDDDDGVTVEIGAGALGGGMDAREGTPQERAIRLVRENTDKATNIIKGWLGEITPSEEGDTRMLGPVKAATFLLTMGEGRASDIFKKLNDNEIRQVATVMTQIREILPDDLSNVCEEFIERFEGDTKLMVESGDFLRNVIKNTLPGDRAEEILKELEALQRDQPFGWSRDVNITALSTALTLEHPQTIAMIMAHLPADIASDVLVSFPEEMKGDIALRVARLGQIPEEIVRDVDGALRDELKNMVSSGGKVGGLQVLVDIIGGVDKSTEDTVMEMIEDEDMEMAMNVRDMMFVFEDMVGIDDRGMREILKKVEGAQLTVALKTASEEMKSKILGNLSSRAAEMILEDLEVMGPVKLSEVEGAQQAVVQAAKDLEADGTITIGGKGKDDVLV